MEVDGLLVGAGGKSVGDTVLPEPAVAKLLEKKSVRARADEWERMSSGIQNVYNHAPMEDGMLLPAHVQYVRTCSPWWCNAMASRENTFAAWSMQSQARQAVHRYLVGLNGGQARGAHKVANAQKLLMVVESCGGDDVLQGNQFALVADAVGSAGLEPSWWSCISLHVVEGDESNYEGIVLDFCYMPYVETQRPTPPCWNHWFRSFGPRLRDFGGRAESGVERGEESGRDQRDEK